MKKRVCAALLTAALCLGLLAGCGDSASGGNNVIYLTAENELQLLKSLSPDSESIELTDRVADPEIYSENSSFLKNFFSWGYSADGQSAGPLVWHGSDGKTLYFLARMGYESATLYRADIGQMKSGSDKNDTFVEKIDSGVFVSSIRLTAAGLLYEKSGDNGRRLYYYNGQESIKLIDNAWEKYWLTDDGQGLLYQTYNQGDETNSLYYLPITGDSDREKLAADVSSVYYSSGVLLYTKYRDGKYDVYTVAPGQESVKLASGASGSLNAWGKSFYYEVIDSQELPLYQFVDDPNPPVDTPANDTETAPRAEPFLEDYRLDPDMNTVEEYEQASGYKITDMFEAGTVDDPEVQQAYKYEMENSYGPLYDKEAYDAACEECDELSRASLRRQLKENTVTVSRSQLCFFNGTESVLVCGDVDSTQYLDPATQTALYSKNQRSVVAGKLSINDIYSAGEVRDWYDAQSQVTTESGLWYYTMGSAAEGELEPDGSWEALGLINGGKELILRLHENSELVSYPIQEGVLGKPASIAEDVSYCKIGAGKNTVFYYENVSDGTGDLCRYQNSVSETLAEDVSRSDYNLSNCIYSDGVTLGLRDLSFSGGTLTRFEKGEGTRVADDVTYYLRLSGQSILYLSDDNLYFYDGKEKQRLSSDVILAWSPDVTAGVLV